MTPERSSDRREDINRIFNEGLEALEIIAAAADKNDPAACRFIRACSAAAVRVASSLICKQYQKQALPRW